MEFAPVVEHLPGIYESLRPTPSAHKRRTKAERRPNNTNQNTESPPVEVPYGQSSMPYFAGGGGGNGDKVLLYNPDWL